MGLTCGDSRQVEPLVGMNYCPSSTDLEMLGFHVVWLLSGNLPCSPLEQNEFWFRAALTLIFCTDDRIDRLASFYLESSPNSTKSNLKCFFIKIHSNDKLSGPSTGRRENRQTSRGPLKRWVRQFSSFLWQLSFSCQ